MGDADKTRVISLKSLQKVKTEKVRKKRLKKLEKELKKKKVQRNDKKTLNNAIITALIIFGIGYGAMKAVQAYKKRTVRRTIVAQMKETRLVVDDAIESFDESALDLQIPDAQLLSAAEIAKHIDDVNCTLTEEVFFCKRMPRANKKNGAVSLNENIIIYLEQKDWMSRAEQLVAFHSALNAENQIATTVEKTAEKHVGDEDEAAAEPEVKKEDEGASIDVLNRIAFLSYLKEYLGRGLTPELKERNYYFVFYTKSTGEMQIESVMAIRGNLIGQVNTRYTEDFFRFKKYNPYQIIKRLDRFYKIY
jgi:hypothetical protein